MKRGLKIAIITTGIIAVLVIATALLISPVAKWYLEKHGKELVGRELKMDELKFNIFNGKLRLTNFRMMEADDTTTFASLGRYYMQIKLLPIIRHKVIVEQVSLDSLDVSLYQRGSEFNFDDIIAFFAADSTAQPEKQSKPWEIGIYNISLDNSHLYYKDLELNAEWSFKDLGLKIPGVYFSGRNTDVGVVLNFAEGGSLETSITYDMEKSDYDLRIKLSDLTLAGTLPYFQQSLDVTAVDGRLSADMHVKGNMDHLMDFTVDGNADLSGFRLDGSGDIGRIKADALHVDLKEANLKEMKYIFNKVHLSGLSSSVVMRTDGSINLMSLIKPSSASSAEVTVTNNEPTPEMQMRIGNLELSNCSIAFTDNTIAKPFHYNISAIHIRSNDFGLDKRNKMVIEGKMQKSGFARVIWDGSMTDMSNQNIMVALSNIALLDFTPYCEHYTAYPLTTGNMTFRSQNVVSNRYLNGTNHLDIFEPKVEKKRKDIEPEFKIPLKLGLYILKDRKGHVKMDLPVKGSLDSPEFSYKKIILKTIGNLLLKVVTAPFSFLSGHNDNIEYIDIDGLQRAFSSEQYSKFDKIAQMIQDKPEIKITLTQRLNYAGTIAKLSEGNLKMAYYRTVMSARDSTQQMSLIEIDRIHEMNIKTPEIGRFTDSICIMRGIDFTKLNIHQKAIALYSGDAEKQMAAVMNSRDKALTEYMTTMQGLSPDRFRTRRMEAEESKAYAGKDRYTISLEVDGESIDIPHSQENTAHQATGETTHDTERNIVPESAVNAAEPSQNVDVTAADIVSPEA